MAPRPTPIASQDAKTGQGAQHDVQQGPVRGEQAADRRSDRERNRTYENAIPKLSPIFPAGEAFGQVIRVLKVPDALRVQIAFEPFGYLGALEADEIDDLLLQPGGDVEVSKAVMELPH